MRLQGLSKLSEQHTCKLWQLCGWEMLLSHWRMPVLYRLLWHACEKLAVLPDIQDKLCFVHFPRPSVVFRVVNEGQAVQLESQGAWAGRPLLTLRWLMWIGKVGCRLLRSAFCVAINCPATFLASHMCFRNSPHGGLKPGKHVMAYLVAWVAPASRCLVGQRVLFLQ
jgi:hypothetical protein